MARILGVPSSTLRYYDKEGLLPFVARSSGGIRIFTEKDYEWLKVISCLKKAGTLEVMKHMTVDDIPERFQNVRRELQDMPEQEKENNSQKATA